jgi:hypothetical protein
MGKQGLDYVTQKYSRRQIATDLLNYINEFNDDNGTQVV